MSEFLDGHHVDDGEGSDGCEGPCDRGLGLFVSWLCCQERFEVGVGVELLYGDGTGAGEVTFGHEMHAEVPTRVPSHLFAGSATSARASSIRSGSMSSVHTNLTDMDSSSLHARDH